MAVVVVEDDGVVGECLESRVVTGHYPRTTWCPRHGTVILQVRHRRHGRVPIEVELASGRVFNFPRLTRDQKSWIEAEVRELRRRLMPNYAPQVLETR